MIGLWRESFEFSKFETVGKRYALSVKKPSFWHWYLLESHVHSHVLVLMEGFTLSAKFCVGLWVMDGFTHQVPSLNFWGKQWMEKSMALNFFEYLHASNT